MKSNTPLTILAVAIGLALTLPQFKACGEYLTRQEADKRVAEEKAATDYWNSNVEPLKQRCLSSGGMPEIFDIPNTGQYEWQVRCNYPVSIAQPVLVVTEGVISWIHNDPGPGAEAVRQRLRQLGWKCCQ